MAEQKKEVEYCKKKKKKKNVLETIFIWKVLYFLCVHIDFF
jgi:hypothetical protein